jgi:hypothetical protein
MPAIFSKEKLSRIWDLLKKNVPLVEIQKQLSIDDDSIDAYLLAAAKKFAVPKLNYKADRQMKMFAVNSTGKSVKRRKVFVEKTVIEDKAQPFVRAKAQYSNPQYNNMYI